LVGLDTQGGHRSTGNACADALDPIPLRHAIESESEWPLVRTACRAECGVHASAWEHPKSMPRLGTATAQELSGEFTPPGLGKGL
jgi:hypothetical protein